MSEKRDRFVRTTERRVRRILRDLRMLGNCSRPNAYDYTAADARRIFRAIDAELVHTKQLFRDERPERAFSLEEEGRSPRHAS